MCFFETGVFSEYFWELYKTEIDNENDRIYKEQNYEFPVIIFKSNVFFNVKEG